MADVRRIIQDILSDPKIATNSNFAGKVYRDEPILITAPQMANFTPPRIRAMRKLAKPQDSEARIFYEQGKFMEDFEDEFDFRNEVVRYFPTYQAMTDVQLRGYFAWRTNLRRGDVRRTSLSFAFMYVYELLNGIGVASPEDGHRALKEFREAYRRFDHRLGAYVEIWLKDYIVYHDLPPELLEGLPDVAFERAITVLLNYEAYGAEEVFAALNALSSYDLSQSKFFTVQPDDVKHAAVRVFAALSAYYNKSAKSSAREKLFGRTVVNTYMPFRSAVFHERGVQKNRTYTISDSHRYICRDGVWSCERFVGYGLNNKKIGAILKTVDFLLREAAGYKSALQPGKVSKVIRGKIEKEIAKYAADKRENTLRTVNIDVSKLSGIRESALATQGRLLVEESEKKNAIEEMIEPVKEEPGAEAAPSGLTETEQHVLRALLQGEKYVAYLRERNILESVVIDAINEKCFDIFNDTVIQSAANNANNAEAYEIVEDYTTELKRMLRP